MKWGERKRVSEREVIADDKWRLFVALANFTNCCYTQCVSVFARCVVGSWWQRVCGECLSAGRSPAAYVIFRLSYRLAPLPASSAPFVGLALLFILSLVQHTTESPRPVHTFCRSPLFTTLVEREREREKETV